MRQILFHIPIPFGGKSIPIFFWGVMLAVAFMVCTWLAARRSRQAGINPQHIQDMSLWLFLGGITGGRLMSMIVEPVPGQTWVDFFKFWEGGMVLYGAILGGTLAYIYTYFRIVRKHHLSNMQLADIIAPCIAVGLIFGRIGCFLSGCCYGNVADPAKVSWGVSFPAYSQPFQDVVKRGYQSAYGFTLEDPGDNAKQMRTTPMVQAVDPNAEAAGLRVGDFIRAVWSPRDNEWIKLDDVRIIAKIEEGQIQETPVSFLWYGLHNLVFWSPGDVLRMKVEHAGGKEEEITIQPPRSLPLHPTQLYSAFDGLILYLLLIAYHPFRRRHGELLALLMMAYAITRFLIEGLRIDNPEYAFGLTFSQNISIGLFLGGVIFFAWLRLRTPPIPKAVPSLTE